MNGRSERVVVTGASRGIGRAVASRLLSEGRRVALVARDRDALEAIAVRHPGAVVIAADLANENERRSVIDRACAAMGAVDGAVLAAGIALHRPALDVREEDLHAQWTLNALAAFTLAQRASAAMIRDGLAGSIVAVASTLAVRGAPGTAGYAMSKAALVAGMRGLAIELGSHQIRVNSVLLGLVDTEMVRARDRTAHDQARMASLHLLGRIGTPEEAAAAILHALDQSWMTGAEVVVDGGLLARE